MTPKSRATLYYYAGIPAGALVALAGYLANRDPNFVTISFLVLTILGFLLLAGFSIFSSR